MNGIDIITATLPYKHRPSSLGSLIENVDMRTNINLKAIPHIDGRMAVLQLVARELASVTVDECWQGPSTVELRPNAGSAGPSASGARVPRWLLLARLVLARGRDGPPRLSPAEMRTSGAASAR